MAHNDLLHGVTVKLDDLWYWHPTICSPTALVESSPRHPEALLNCVPGKTLKKVSTSTTKVSKICSTPLKNQSWARTLMTSTMAGDVFKNFPPSSWRTTAETPKPSNCWVLPIEATPHGQVLEATTGSPIVGPTRCSHGPLADSKLHQTTLRRVAASAGQSPNLY